MLADEMEQLVDFFSLTLEERISFQNSLAGEEGTRMLNDIVMHLFDMGFVWEMAFGLPSDSHQMKVGSNIGGKELLI